MLIVLGGEFSRHLGPADAPSAGIDWLPAAMGNFAIHPDGLRTLLDHVASPYLG
jgi:hypothetical protein